MFALEQTSSDRMKVLQPRISRLILHLFNAVRGIKHRHISTSKWSEMCYSNTGLVYCCIDRTERKPDGCGLTNFLSL